jgi:hypothetical protein
MIRRVWTITCVAALAAVPSRAVAQQDLAKAVIKTFDLDSVLVLLKAEGFNHQLTFIKSDTHGATFEREEGVTQAGVRQVPIIREVVFHYEKARTGTRVVATETLIVRGPGGQETRHDIDHDTKATDLQQMLNDAKAKSMPPGGDTTKSSNY